MVRLPYYSGFGACIFVFIKWCIICVQIFPMLIGQIYTLKALVYISVYFSADAAVNICFSILEVFVSQLNMNILGACAILCPDFTHATNV